MWFSSQNYNLIFGGSETGLMYELVKGIYKDGCKIISIFTKNLYNDSPRSKYFSEL